MCDKAASPSLNSVTELDASDGTWISTLSGGSYGFSEPYGIGFDGTDIWVANNGDGDSVTEFDASDSSWISTLQDCSAAAPAPDCGNYGLDAPAAVASDGTHIWVASILNGTVSEFDTSDGTLIRTLSGGDYGFNRPIGVIATATRIWVVNSGDTSVTELNASDGTLVRTLPGVSHGYSYHPQPIPVGIASDGGHHIWVVSSGTNSVTELTIG